MHFSGRSYTWPVICQPLRFPSDGFVNQTILSGRTLACSPSFGDQLAVWIFPSTAFNSLGAYSRGRRIIVDFILLICHNSADTFIQRVVHPQKRFASRHHTLACMLVCTSGIHRGILSRSLQSINLHYVFIYSFH